ncbi:phage portal protein [Thioclava litoralis]|uniref:Phage portal protein n=1 Tax=Thioclava litoralis TaxID=3076557 RepID=A0ABZ1DZP3_9RHOB|nr:phage portal protein [Thioclava sp. FTW29]
MADRIKSPGLLDRMIGYLAPEAGLARMVARQRLGMLMHYDAASRSSRTSSWHGSASSADRAGMAQGARARLRGVTRDFVRNRPYAARGISVITGNVVGTGIIPSVKAGADRTRMKAEEIVLGHLGSTDLDAMGVLHLAGLQRAAMNAVVEDGEVLVRRRWRQGAQARRLKLPFQIELLETDYLCPWVTSHGDNEVIDGLEIGPEGRVVAYHLFRQHPGTASTRTDLSVIRVPAEDILHIRRIDRPGQLRGISWFAPVLLTLGDLSDYQEGEILKQKMAALMAGFIEREDNDGPASSSDAEEEAEAMGLSNVAPGTLTELPPGTKISWSTPPKVDGYDLFMRQTLAAVAMGLGITYEALAGDLSHVNFSSGRMGRMEMDRNVETWQQQVMIGQLCEGLGRWTLEAWQMAFLRAPGFTLGWTAPRRPVIDPTREIPAKIREIEAGLTSRQRAQREMGLDPAVIRRERIEDAAQDDTEGGGPVVPAPKTTPGAPVAAPTGPKP